jgi:predicted double-glycine peptidase
VPPEDQNVLQVHADDSPQEGEDAHQNMGNEPIDEQYHEDGSMGPDNDGRFSSDFVFTEMFKAIDVSQAGRISRADMEMAAKAIGWKASQLSELIEELDPQHHGDVTYEEFMLITRYIESKAPTVTLPDPSLKQSSTGLPEHHAATSPPQASGQESLLSSANNSYPQLSAYEEDKRKYGALLPKTGVYFLPDERIVAFLRVVNEMRKRYEAAGNYLYANRYKKIFEHWSEDEQRRLLKNMRDAQQRELENITGASEMQYQEFTIAWDKYMADYEQTAFQLVQNLASKQEQEVAEMRAYWTERFYNEHRWTKNVVEMRKQERIYFSVKDYINAEKVKQLCQALERKEVDEM